MDADVPSDAVDAELGVSWAEVGRPGHRRRLVGRALIAAVAVAAAVAAFFAFVDHDDSISAEDPGPLNSPNAPDDWVGTECAPMSEDTRLWVAGAVRVRNDSTEPLEIIAIEGFGVTDGFEILQTGASPVDVRSGGYCVEDLSSLSWQDLEVPPYALDDLGPIPPFADSGADFMLMVEGRLQPGHESAEMLGFSVTYNVGGGEHITEEYLAPVMFCARDDSPQCNGTQFEWVHERLEDR